MLMRRGLAGFAMVLLAASGAWAQGGLTRTVLQQTDFPAGYTTMEVLVEIAPGFVVPTHTHPGVESGYVMEGEGTLLVRGQPDRAVKAGDSYQFPAGAPHGVRSGDKPMKLAVTYVVEQGKPLASPAP